MGPSTRSVLLFLAALVVLPTLASGQVFVEPAGAELHASPGSDATLNVTLTNPTARTYFVLATVRGNLTRETVFDPTRFQLDPDGSRRVNVTVRVPSDAEFDTTGTTLLFTIVDRQTGESIEKEVPVALTVDRKDFFLGLFDVRLPQPLTRGWGLFTAEVVVWATLSFLFASLVGTVLHWAIPGTTEDTQERMAALVKAPIWYLTFVLGLNFSWRLVPRTPIIDVFDRLNNAVAIVVAGVLAYRGVTAGLIYYAENVAEHTDTKMDDLLVPVFEKIGAALIVGVAAFYTFRVLGVDLSFLVAGGLVAGLVISMAAQDTLSNFFSGIFILIDRPFREGDELMLDSGEICRVEDIGLRSTKLYHFQNHRQIIVPNNDLATKRVVNMSYPDLSYRIVVPMGVAYDTDLELAKRIVLEAAQAHPEVLGDAMHEPVVFLKEFGDSSINLELRAFVPSSRRRNPVQTDLVVAIKRAFDEHGIEIPFPQRVVWFHEGGRRLDVAVGEQSARGDGAVPGHADAADEERA